MTGFSPLWPPISFSLGPVDPSVSVENPGKNTAVTLRTSVESTADTYQETSRGKGGLGAQMAKATAPIQSQLEFWIKYCSEFSSLQPKNGILKPSDLFTDMTALLS